MQNFFFLIFCLIPAFSFGQNYDPKPSFHLLPPSQWMNDPNGAFFYEGMHHMFYQYNPEKAVWGDIHWGHAVSPDLVHWKRLPVALSPSNRTFAPDNQGIWSGGAAFDTAGMPHLFYTGQGTMEQTAGNQHQCSASPTHSYLQDPDFKKWTKNPKNPLIAHPPPQEMGPNYSFRDPFIFPQGKPTPQPAATLRHMLLGGGADGENGRVLIYVGDSDLDHWEFSGIFLNSTGWTDIMECPQLIFFENNQTALIVSSTVTRMSHYYVGSLHKSGPHLSFVPAPTTPTLLPVADQPLAVDGGMLYAAAISYVPRASIAASPAADDEDTVPVLYGWLEDLNSLRDMTPEGWAGVHTIPRVMTLEYYPPANAKLLHFAFVDSLRSLRGTPTHFSLANLGPALTPPPSSIPHSLQYFGLKTAPTIQLFPTPLPTRVDLEGQLILSPGTATPDCVFGLVFAATSDLSEASYLLLNTSLIGLDTTASTVAVGSGRGGRQLRLLPHPLRTEGSSAVTVRLVRDGGMFEICVDRISCFSQYILPSTGGEAAYAGLFRHCSGAEGVAAAEFAAYPLASIWEE
eukprot:GCRY01001534.1.p1 GENE.GCRY01001534.1~~GCRY01001534.1.p1  ORF type:complete len:571 (-),score=157.89 GCRY01001534.1:181-1893(-)